MWPECDQPDRERSCCISVDPYCRPEYIYGDFIALACLYQKVLPKKKLLVTLVLHNLKWLWRHEEGSPVAIFRVRVPSLPVTRRLRVFRMVFVQKRCLSIFAHWLIMKRSQNWSEVTDNKIPRCIFHRYCNSYQSLKVPSQSFNRCSYELRPTLFFSEVRSLGVTWRPDLEWPGCELFTTCAEEIYQQVCQKWWRSARPFFFFRYLRKKPEGCQNTPGRARVDHHTPAMSDMIYAHPVLLIWCDL